MDIFIKLLHTISHQKIITSNNRDLKIYSSFPFYVHGDAMTCSQIVAKIFRLNTINTHLLILRSQVISLILRLYHPSMLIF